MYFWQKFHRIPNIRKHMMSICSLSGDFNLDYWIRRCRPVFSHKVTIFLFAIKQHIVRTTVPWFLTCQVGKRGVLRGWGRTPARGSTCPAPSFAPPSPCSGVRVTSFPGDSGSALIATPTLPALCCDLSSCKWLLNDQ